MPTTKPEPSDHVQNDTFKNTTRFQPHSFSKTLGIWPRLEESVQAHIDLQGKTMVPIHNGTFDLAFHSWYEPFDQVSTEAERRAVTLSTPIFGQIFKPQDALIKNQWWQLTSP